MVPSSALRERSGRRGIFAVMQKLSTTRRESEAACRGRASRGILRELRGGDELRGVGTQLVVDIALRRHPIQSAGA